MCKKKTINRCIILITGIVLTLLFVACSSDENNPTEQTSEPDLNGVWKQTSLSWTNSYNCGCYSNAQLDSLGIVWELTLYIDNTVEQVKNLDDSLITQTGTWVISGNQLGISLIEPTTDKVSSIDYKFVVEDNLLYLSWVIATGTEFSSELAKQ